MRVSGNDVFDYLAFYIGEPELAALEQVSQLLVVDPQQVQDGRLQIVHVDASLHDIEAIIVRAAVDVAGA